MLPRLAMVPPVARIATRGSCFMAAADGGVVTVVGADSAGPEMRKRAEAAKAAKPRRNISESSE